jgi:ABC-type transporter Mla subunit MlaD
MPLPVWIGLIVLLVATTLGAFHLFRSVREFLRTFKSFSGAVDGAMSELTRSLDRLARSTESLEPASARLQATLARLRASLARMAVLRAAVQDAQDAVGRLAAVYPRK